MIASFLRSRRWLLWGALLALVLALLAVLVFLAAEYEETRDQEALDADAAVIASDIRSGLLRNVQTLQSLHSVAPSEDTWQAPAAELLVTNRELVRLEWRDVQLRPIAVRNTPYLLESGMLLARAEAQADVQQACDNARRVSGPAYSPSYFAPLRNGQGLELFEMCLPVSRAGVSNGYLVATYSLVGVLAEMTDKDLLRGRGLAFTEADGTRLALLSSVGTSRRVQVGTSLLDLPGHTLVLRLERPRAPYVLFPNVLTAVVGVLSLSLLAVLALLGHDIRRRQRVEHELADALAFRKAMEDSLVTGLRARGLDGRVTYVNPAFCQMVGFSAEQLIGSGFPAPWWPPELVDEYQQRQAVRLAGQALPREGWESVFQRSDGTRFPVLIIEAPLIDAQGVQTGWMSAILDLTEQRRVEELNPPARTACRPPRAWRPWAKWPLCSATNSTSRWRPYRATPPAPSTCSTGRPASCGQTNCNRPCAASRSRPNGRGASSRAWPTSCAVASRCAKRCCPPACSRRSRRCWVCRPRNWVSACRSMPRPNCRPCCATAPWSSRCC